MGSSLLTLFVSLGRRRSGFWTILIAHIMFCLSASSSSRSRRGSPAWTRASSRRRWTSTPTESQTFRRVTLPLVLPGIAAGALLALLAVLRRLHHHQLQRGHDSITFPMFVWGAPSAGTPVADQRDRHGDVPASRCSRSGWVS